MPYKVKNKARKYVKKRYTTRTKGFRWKRALKDISYLKGALNSERKHIQIQFGEVGGAFKTRQVVTKSAPICQVLTPLDELPAGHENGQRVGDNVKLTSISYKGTMMLDNLNNKSQTTRAELYIIQVKDSENELTIAKLFELDENGDRSVNSYWVEEEYNKFTVLAKHTFSLRQYLPSTSGSAPANRVEEYFSNHLQYDNEHRIMCKYNSAGQLETNSLYVVCVTDSLMDSDSDKLQFSINMKINYVDN